MVHIFTLLLWTARVQGWLYSEKNKWFFPLNKKILAQENWYCTFYQWTLGLYKVGKDLAVCLLLHAQVTRTNWAVKPTQSTKSSSQQTLLPTNMSALDYTPQNTYASPFTVTKLLNEHTLTQGLYKRDTHSQTVCSIFCFVFVHLTIPGLFVLILILLWPGLVFCHCLVEVCLLIA